MKKYRPLAIVHAVCGYAALLPANAQPMSTASSERHVYFGDLHLHTTLSLDAWAV